MLEVVVEQAQVLEVLVVGEEAQVLEVVVVGEEAQVLEVVVVVEEWLIMDRPSVICLIQMVDLIIMAWLLPVPGRGRRARTKRTCRRRGWRPVWTRRRRRMCPHQHVGVLMFAS